MAGRAAPPREETARGTGPTHHLYRERIERICLGVRNPIGVRVFVGLREVMLKSSTNIEPLPSPEYCIATSAEVVVDVKACAREGDDVVSAFTQSTG